MGYMEFWGCDNIIPIFILGCHILYDVMFPGLGRHQLDSGSEMQYAKRVLGIQDQLANTITIYELLKQVSSVDPAC